MLTGHVRTKDRLLPRPSRHLAFSSVLRYWDYIYNLLSLGEPPTLKDPRQYRADRPSLNRERRNVFSARIGIPKAPWRAGDGAFGAQRPPGAEGDPQMPCPDGASLPA